jgi:DNA-binding Lrp family transcriptional regulator
MLSLPLESQKHYVRFRDILASVDGAVAVIEHGGAHALELRTFSHGLFHLQSIFETIAKQFSHPFHIHESLTILEHEYPGLVPLGPLAKDRPILGFGPLPAGARTIHLEERDHAILFALCNSNYMTWNQIARELSIPTTTLTHRIANLEKWGVIQGHYYVLDVKVFNDMPILLQISSRALKEAERAAIRKFCRLHPKVAWMSLLFGSISAEMLVRVQSHEEARAIMSDISDHFVGVIDRVYMTPPLKFFKWSDYPFKKYVPFGVA